MDSFIKGVRHFLFGWANREFLIFLFFLALAGIFWLLTTLNESFEQEVKMPLAFVNVPKNVVITSGEHDTLRVTVRDKGISLLTYIYNKEPRPLEIDFARYAATDGTGAVPSGDLLRLANAKLPASAKAISVKPETQHFYYNNGEKKTVPVVYQGRVEPNLLYYISAVTYEPDSLITIYASEQKLDSITCVYTQPISAKDFRDSLVVTVPLNRIEGVKMVPDQVTVHFRTDMLTEVTVTDIPVVGINMPEGMVLRTFPAKLSVSIVTGMKHYQTISPADFLIVADYNELQADSTARCNVYLRRQPDGVKRVRMETQQVDYLIEVMNER